jgi:protein TonB
MSSWRRAFRAEVRGARAGAAYLAAMQIGFSRHRIASAAGVLAIEALLLWALLTGGVGPATHDDPLPTEVVPVTIAPPRRAAPPSQPRRAASRPSQAPAPPNLRAVAKPLVAPPPIVPITLPPPILAAPVAADAADVRAGAAPVAGPGTGSGGVGDGLGGGERGGVGDGDDRETPPRWRSGRLRDADYPRAAGEAGAGGTVAVRYRVGIDGRVRDCRVTGSSGNAALDTTTCRLIERRFRFDPSRDAAGRPVPSTIVERHSWLMPFVPEPDARR